MFLTNSITGTMQLCASSPTKVNRVRIATAILDILIPITAVVLGALALAHVVHFLPQSVSWGFVSAGGALTLAAIGLMIKGMGESAAANRVRAGRRHNPSHNFGN